MHWGYNGVVMGDIANDPSLVADPNLIHEAKAFLCQVRKA